MPILDETEVNYTREYFARSIAAAPSAKRRGFLLCASYDELRERFDAQRAEIAELRTSAMRYGYAHARCEGAEHGGIIAPMEDACDECKDEAARRFPAAVSQERQDATHNNSTEK